MAEGLSRPEARARYDKIGPNEVPYKPETMWVSIAEEMFTLFKVYQFLIYSIWLWFSYLFVGALLLSIVLVAAFITAANRRRAQFAIAKVCGSVKLFMPQQQYIVTLTDSSTTMKGEYWGAQKIVSSWLLLLKSMPVPSAWSFDFYYFRFGQALLVSNCLTCPRALLLI